MQSILNFILLFSIILFIKHYYLDFKLSQKQDIENMEKECIHTEHDFFVHIGIDTSTKWGFY